MCGGIPIIHSLQTDFFADDITKVMGIMNGTTNFMLCKMEDEGAQYSEALKEAQVSPTTFKAPNILKNTYDNDSGPWIR